MAATPDEDKPQITPEELRNREDGAGTGSAGSSSGNSGGSTSGAGGGNLGGTSGASTSSAGGGNGSFYRPSSLKRGEESGSDPGVSYYDPEGDHRVLFRTRRGKSGKPKKRGFMARNKFALGVISALISCILALAAFFGAGLFDLANFMKNIEQAGFQRYQLDLNGRSSSWLSAYMELRFGEIDDPNLAPGDRDNLLFRSNNVSNNQPLRDWYRTLRTSNFEQDVFGREGIKFTSVAYQDGNIIKFRPGKVTFPNGGEVQFDPTKLGYNELDALSTGDINNLNGRLRNTFDVQTFNSDKEARAAIKDMVNKESPGWWKAAKRYAIRKDIQNMIGVRSWTFFEKTQTKVREGITSFRNKIITEATPDNSKAGDFIKCFFGVPDCSSSSDVANPDNQAPTPTGTDKTTADKTDGNPKDPQPLGNGSAEGDLTDVATKGAAGDAGALAGEIVSKIIDKAGLFSLLDSLARFNEAVQSNTFSKIVAVAKEHQVEGLFTVFGVAADQLTTGQQSSSEVNSFMLQFQHSTNSEGWATVVDPENNPGQAAADSTGYVQAKNKTEFCSPQHQAEMQQNPAQAENEFQWSCPQDKVGGTDNAKQLEDAWNNDPLIKDGLSPVLNTYHAATGGIFNVFNSITSAVSGPAINAALEITHTKQDVNDVAGAAASKALALGGATSITNDNTPSGQISNNILQGSAVTAEAATRYAGGIPSTPATVAQTQKAIASYQVAQAHTSLFNRYLSPSNPKSLFATEFFALTTSGLSNLGQSLISTFGSAVSAPLRALSQPAHAAVPDGYAACHFAEIQCNDIPQQCLNISPLDMTPQNSTNADELGYFKPDELTWSLMTNEADWYKALYDKVGGDENKAFPVYNCALFDDTSRSDISAPYGNVGVNGYQSSGGSGGGGTAPSGPTSPVTGNFTNPFPGGWVPNRLDMGYDGTFKGQIVAPFDGTVTYAGSFTGWNGSLGVILQATHDVGLPTKSLYFTEGVSPIAGLQGKTVTAGTPIANATASPYGDAYAQGSAVGGIEWGVMEDGNIGQFVDTEAVALGNCSAASKSMVLSFSQWAQTKLGVAPPATTDHAGCA